MDIFHPFSRTACCSLWSVILALKFQDNADMFLNCWWFIDNQLCFSYSELFELLQELKEQVDCMTQKLETVTTLYQELQTDYNTTVINIKV